MDYMHTLFCFLFKCSANHATGSSQSSKQVGSSYYSYKASVSARVSPWPVAASVGLWPHQWACGHISGPVATSVYHPWQRKRGNACDLEAGP